MSIEHINKTDTLNEGREKINAAIDSKLDVRKSTFNGVLACSQGGVKVDLKNEKVITKLVNGGIYVNKKYHRLITGEYSFADLVNDSLYITFDTETSNVVFLNNDELMSSDMDRYGVFGIMRRDAKKAWIQGSSYDVDISQNKKRNPLNAILNSHESSFIVDFIDNEIRTRRAGGFVNVNGTSYNLKDGSYPIPDDIAQSVYIAVEIDTMDIVYFSSNELSDLDYSKYGVVGNVRRDAQKAWIQGSSYEVKQPLQPNPEPDPVTVPKYILSGDDFSDYNANIHYTEIDKTLTASDIVDLYDNLTSEYPDYMTKKEIGRSANNKPIYIYDWKTKQVQTTDYKHPKILIVGNIHGHEKQSTFGLLSFFKDLSENWKSQHSLQFMKSNAHISLIPILNPDGYDADTRKNGNGVDLGRNFPTGWSANPNPENLYYPGPNPASEPETNIILDYLNQNQDIYYAIDVHNYGGIIGTTTAGYLSSNTEITKKVNHAFYKYYDLKLRVDFENLMSLPDSMGDVRSPTVGGGMNGEFASKGIHSSLLELPTHMETTDSDSIQVNSDMIGNYLLHVIREHRDLF